MIFHLELSESDCANYTYLPTETLPHGVTSSDNHSAVPLDNFPQGQAGEAQAAGLLSAVPRTIEIGFETFAEQYIKDSDEFQSCPLPIEYYGNPEKDLFWQQAHSGLGPCPDKPVACAQTIDKPESISQLQLWVYDTINITFAEALVKQDWEAKKLEKI